MKRTPTRLMAVGLAAGIVALTACGSDDNDAAETATSEVMTETSEAMTETSEAMTEEPGTIVDVAVANGSFTTLVAAVQAAGLAETLSGPGPFTVFAPTDEAFAAVPPDVLAALLLPENKDTLAKILTYHVVSGEVLSSDIVAGDVPTVEGESVTLATDGGVTVNDATVVTADVPASNGVIHVIDAVLIPPDVDLTTLAG